MSTLVLILSAPMQSWGARAAFTERDTMAHPTRSGVVGLLASTLGQAREEDLSWADGLTIHVRADAPGQVMTDFHMVGGGYPEHRALVNAAGRTRKQAGALSPALTHRRYLADATFVVTITGDDHLIDRLSAAVRRPRWPPFLGRRSCPPALPLLLGTTPVPGEEVLHRLPAYAPALAPAPARQGARVEDDSDWFAAIAAIERDRDAAVDAGAPCVERTVYLDGVAAAETYTEVRDVPVSFDPTLRTFTSRRLGMATATVPTAGVGLPGWRALHRAVAALA
ncbi:type I-E CRISPR-associated protein Cas5/CasD [Quadrisphaera sp. DSM 44207]|uniref:type I-E CRISPR-associated protein Cas5/CasD n=1 Tax=Quadrisphaera sp. DSM 44207 TaxID=1881057 RepID=UPI00088C44C4|nr:type I-E CRISPR-associated protein Cas5/CasD [Quadrisphaera sp. DSM 44207]SDQ03919.1 CRISPR-associated protein, Cas5e family [Quadrisphaera sp. DSM 44207]